jgi:hypothetical protein
MAFSHASLLDEQRRPWAAIASSRRGIDDGRIEILNQTISQIVARDCQYKSKEYKIEL